MTKIEQQVMGSVAVIYAARQLMSATALKLYVCAASLYGIASLVWVAKVFENLERVGIADSLQFVIAAVLNTNTLVQLLLIVGAFAALSLVIDLVRSISIQRRLAL